MKNLLHNTYLVRLYEYDKKLFGIIVGFFSLTLIANVFKAQAAPFFVWGMFSERISVKEEFQVMKITVNDSILIDYTAGYRHPHRFYLSSPVNAYVEMQQNNHLDKAMIGYPDKLSHRIKFYRAIVEKTINHPEQYKALLEWYSRYIREVRGIAVTSLNIQLVYCHYDEDHKLKEDSSRVVNKSFF